MSLDQVDVERLQRIEALLRELHDADFGRVTVTQQTIDDVLREKPLDVEPPPAAGGHSWWSWVLIFIVCGLALIGGVALGLTATAWWVGL